MYPDKFEQLRKEQYPLTEKYAYLDTASTGMLSTRTRNALVDYIDYRYENGLTLGEFGQNWKHADEMRSTIAKVINADPEEIFYSDSTSGTLNVFSAGIELPENANVVTSGQSFPSTVFNWKNRVGSENVRIAAPENGAMPVERLFELVDENTKVMALCFVENTTGYRYDLQKISSFCQEHNIYLALDITQCITGMKIDVKETPVDFMAAASYKWLGGLFGVGFGYVSKRVLDKVHPAYVGWTGVKDRRPASDFTLTLSPTASKFETGSPNWVGIRGMEQSMQIYLELGADDVQEHILSLVDYLYQQAASLNKVGIIGNFAPENRSGIVYLTIPAEWGITDELMKENGIRAHAASGPAGASIRVALHFYNNKEDVDKFIAYLKSFE